MTERFYEVACEDCPDAILVIDEDGIIKLVNNSGQRLFNARKEQMVGERFNFPFHNSMPQELDIVAPGKDPRIAEMCTIETQVKDERIYVVSLRDITQKVWVREQLTTAALIDDLTGLFNRRGFLILAKQQIKLANRTKKGMLLIYIDVDNMKFINDHFGHYKGDLALTQIAVILKDTFRTADIIARVGGDEFVVMAIETGNDNPMSIINRLYDRLEEYNADINHDWNLSISLGAEFYDPENPCRIEELLVRADMQMYQDKQRKHSAGR